MQRRTFLRSALMAGALANPVVRLLARGYRPAADGEFFPIRGNVGYYTNRGGTIGVYLPNGKPEGAVVVDTQFAEAAAAFIDHLRESGDLNRIDLLVNTHHHGDHTSGNSVIAPLARRHLSHSVAKKNLLANLENNDKPTENMLPTVTFDKNWSSNLPDGEVVTVRHFGAAHTGGDGVVHFENANVAHLGDLLFNRRFPYIDPAAGGDILNWPMVLKSIRNHYDRNTLYIFGHAAEGYPVFGTLSDLRAFENYLRSLRRYVRKEIRKGTTLEELKAGTVTIPGAREWSFGERLRDVNLEVMHAALLKDNS